MQDSENNKPEMNESPDAPPAPSQGNDFFGGLGLTEVEATYEMIVGARLAIENNDNWKGKDLKPVAQLMLMLGQMEKQYRSRVEQLRAEQKEALKRAHAEIRASGGQVNGKAASEPAPAPAA